VPAFTRTILVLDHAVGAARVDDDRVVGLDLHPAAARWVEQQAADGRETVTILPAEAAASGTFAGGEAGGAVAFVCTDRALRGRARAEGLYPVAHPALLRVLASVDAVAAGRFAGPRPVLERFAAAHGVVPLHFQPASILGPASDPSVEGESGWALIGVGPPDALADAVLRGLSVVPLDCDPAVDDLVWARIDDASDATRAGLAGRRILFAQPGQVLIALGPDEGSDAMALHGAHGHTELLTPDPGLLQPARAEADVEGANFAGPSPILEEVVVDPAARRLIETARPRCLIVTRGYAGRLDRYTGVTPLDAAGPVASRHISHPDNKRVEAQLLADLSAMGYCPWRHDFLHNGVVHSNVFADLPGQGRFRIAPAVLERLRAILTGGGDQRAAMIDELRSLGPGDREDSPPLDELSEPELRRELERVVALEPWNPWWRRRCPLAGVGAGLVVVGAHLDSTAGFDAGYSPATDPAAGRDDNGSGLAAVLTLAQHFRSLAGRLTHTVRFCFFNAEEAGLVGSKAYAAALKAQRAPVRAVYCLDMIGYNSDTTRVFELHAGYPDPAIRDLSVPLATSVAAAAATAGALLPAQVYRGTGYGGAPDRSVYDGAINRSDHAAFQQQGWGAVLASEDFFVNLASEPAADANPNYHTAADQTVDTSFARAITCAVGRAATLSAL
jgi:Peptidase family M28